MWGRFPPARSTASPTFPACSSGMSRASREMTSGTALEMTRMASEAGVPEGAINVVTGYGDPAGQVLAGKVAIEAVQL